MLSNEKINIDPFDLRSIHLNVVSDDTSDMDLSFRMTFKDGERGTGANLPISFTTSNPYPNPFKNEISFSVTVLKETFISITIFDLLGREIRYIYDGRLLSGRYDYKWDSKNNVGIDTASGTYFIKISDGINQEWKTVTLIR